MQKKNESTNGKGSEKRPTNLKVFNENYDDIDWSAHRRKKESDIEDSERMKIAAEMSKL